MNNRDRIIEQRIKEYELRRAEQVKTEGLERAIYMGLRLVEPMVFPTDEPPELPAAA